MLPLNSTNSLDRTRRLAVHYALHYHRLNNLKSNKVAHVIINMAYYYYYYGSTASVV
jgi:hypothetical protein